MQVEIPVSYLGREVIQVLPGIFDDTSFKFWVLVKTEWK
jgi:hypothetical protein